MAEQKAMDTWIGGTKQNLIMSQGYPSKTASDGGSGEILVYANHVYIPPSNSTFYTNDGVGHTSYNAGANYWHYRMFFCDANGKIYHWILKNEQVPPEQIDVNLYVHY